MSRLHCDRGIITTRIAEDEMRTSSDSVRQPSSWCGSIDLSAVGCQSLKVHASAPAPSTDSESKPTYAWLG